MNKVITTKNITNIKNLATELLVIKDKGFIKTHRKGDTGIGKTLEDLLGIKENNLSIPDVGFAELKAKRINRDSMITLFTKSPDKRGSNGELLIMYGYDVGDGLELHTTINSKDFNTLNGEKFIKIKFDDKNEIMYYEHYYDKRIEFLSYSYKELIKAFTKKYPKQAMVFVLAESKGKSINEEFWYKEAYLLEGFNDKKFIKMLKDGNIFIDIRLGVYDNGRTHDHGTAFRIKHSKLFDCFDKTTRLL